MSLPYPSPSKPRKVLFLCTGNYYRSRMAEEIFNYYAQQKSLDYKAISKGLASNLKTIGNVGPIAPPAVSSLEACGIPVRSLWRWPQTVSIHDFKTAHTVVALNLPEHLPMIRALYPQYADKVIYWHVPDIGEMKVDEALGVLKSQIQELISTL